MEKLALRQSIPVRTDPPQVSQAPDSGELSSRSLQLQLMQMKANDFSGSLKTNKFQELAGSHSLPIQRKIHYKSGVFSGDSSRPGWRKFLKRFVVDEYNKEHPSATISYSTNLTSLNADRCHRVSFNAIQNWVLNYLNGSMNKTKFTQRTDTLYDSDSPDLGEMKAERGRLFKAKTNSDKLAKARNLLSLLNSATANVRIGSDVVNRSIQEQLDMHFVKKKSGKFSASPRSRRMMTNLSASEGNGMPMTPGQSRVKSSNADIPIPLNKFTPKTGKLVKKHRKGK
ncbi:MAG: hypothetical protein EP338_03670 [Bacteroidetes bacterium]|nr:MAG: hypothetical protein EP338_03670 [Bacteroidota bacterium]